MRSILALVLCILLFPFAPVAPALAEEANNRTVTVGIFEFDGYHMQDEDGDLTGYGIELLELIERYSHLNFKMVGYDRSWADMLEMLDSGEIDMVTTARHTPEREEKYAFSLPIGMNNTILSVRLDNKKIVAGDYSTYDGMSVGVIPGSSQNAKLEEFAREKGFSYDVVEYEDVSDMADALQAGEIDAILSSDLRKGDDERTIDTLDKNEFYAIVRKGDVELIDEINYAIGQINLHEGDWQNVLYYRYYGPEYSSALDFTEREKEYIEQVKSGEKTITATALVDRMPYSYLKDGELTGILLDYFAAVMGVVGLPYEVIIPQSPEEYMTLAETNGVDVVIDAVVTGSESNIRDDGYNGFYTDPYMEAGFAVVTRSDSEGHVKVIAVDNTQIEDLVSQYASDGIKVVRYPTTDDAMQAVIDGKADTAYVYSSSAQLFINKDKTNSLHFGLVHDLSAQFAMYVRDTSDHELVTILDKCIQQVPKSKLDQLVAAYTTYSLDDLSFVEFFRANPILVGLAILGLLAGILIIVGIYIRYRWNQRLLRAEEASNRELGEQLAIVDALSRDYTNVFAVDVDRGVAKVIKLEGYVTEGLERNTDIDYEYAPILTTYIETRVHPDDRKSLERELSLPTVKEMLKDSETYVGTYRILSDGEEHHYQYAYTRIDEGADKSFVLAGFRNIDETIRNEQEQKELLAKALTQAQYANKAKTTFLNNMSHDIRTPMNAIIGFTSLANTHLDDPEQVQDYLDKIMTSSNHLLSLINDVLDMSRIESGKVKIEEKETSLLEVMHDMRTIVQADVSAKELDFHIDTHDVHDPIVICDKLRLNQVLLNIMSNAIKYTKPGGTVSVRIVQLTEVRDGHADYEFRIKDTGIGMSPEFLEHVFEPFERENTATVSGIQGTGLGLAITKNIVDVMDGTITVESEVGVGSEFVVNFRFRVADEAEKARYLEESAASSEALSAPQSAGESVEEASAEDSYFDGKKILLVEDNELNSEIAQAILEGVGFIVDTANDGSVAVEKMEQNPAGTYDLILSDVQMPIMDGYEETRIIRAMDDPEKANIPIVAMTANAFEEDREEAHAAGMNDYVHKPIDVKMLMGVLRELL